VHLVRAATYVEARPGLDPRPDISADL